MSNEIDENILLVNAPAGSGKTYRIKSEIRNYIINNPTDKILCITFTNRAAEELLKDIDSKNVYISTIHSYINNLMNPLMKKQEIIDLYFELYTNAILNRIDDPEKQESNNKYKEKYGDISIEIIKKNITSISYNETQFNSLYYGGLSHDDLLLFTSKVLERYPKLYQKINKRFKIIIIDEYQDTSAEVFEMFINAVKNTYVKLYLYGDRMQQIYKLYNNELNGKLAKIKKDDKKIINHRSIPVIVDILNKIYNNNELDQEHYDKLEDIRPSFLPRIVLGPTTELNDIIEKNMLADPETLILYIFNRERFEKIGAKKLFDAYSRMEEYGFGKKISAVEVLLEEDERENKDALLKFLTILYKINKFWQQKIYGSFLKICRENKKIFNSQYISLIKGENKNSIFNIWKEIFEKFNIGETKIRELIELMNSKKILLEGFIEEINLDNMYGEVFDVPICELINLEKNNENSNVSTQHGVKGESHNSVLFVAEDSKRSDPRINMYDFLKVWSLIDFSLDGFEQFYFEYLDFCELVKHNFDFKIKQINAKQLGERKKFLYLKSVEILEKYAENEIFNVLCASVYKNYIKSQTCENAKKCFDDGLISNVLSAYKLFYVGCSRARKNLTVFVDKSKIKDFNEKFIDKAEKIGFKVIETKDI